MKTKVFTKMLLLNTGATLAALLCCQFAFSATVNQEKEKLAKLQSDLVVQEQRIPDIKSELNNLPEEIAKAKDAVTKAEAALGAEEAVVAEAKREHAASPSSSTERNIRLAEIKAGLASTKVRSETRDLERLISEEQELKDQISKAENSIAEFKSQIKAQERRIADTIELARQQELEAAKPKVAAPKPQPKIEVAQPKIEAPKPAAPPVVAPPKPAPKSVADTTAIQATIALNEEEFEEFEFAKREMDVVESLIKESSGSVSPIYNELSLTGTDIDEVPFVYLGNQQYRADAALPPGRQQFRIRGLRFQLDIPRSETAQEYVFLVDARDKNDMHARYFKKVYLSYFDKNVVVKEESVATIKTVAEKDADYEAAEAAKQRLLAAQALAAEAGANDQPNHDSLVLYGSDIDSAQFTYLGNQQYRVDVALPGGRQTFRVKGLNFQLNIPKSESAQKDEYVFIVDAREKNDLEASYFKKDLLSYGEENIATAE